MSDLLVRRRTYALRNLLKNSIDGTSLGTNDRSKAAVGRRDDLVFSVERDLFFARFEDIGVVFDLGRKFDITPRNL